MALRRTKSRGSGLVTTTTDASAGAGTDEQASSAAAPAGVGNGSTAAVSSGSEPASSTSLPAERPLIGAVLVEMGAASQEQVDEAIGRQTAGTRLGKLLIDAGVIEERQLVEALGRQFGLEISNLERTSHDPTVVAKLPEEVARELGAVPLNRSADVVSLAVWDPARPNLVEDLEADMGEPVRLVVATESGVVAAIDRAYEAAGAVSDAVRIFEARASEREFQTANTDTVDANAPVVQVVSRILAQAVQDGASDVHIEPMGERVRVRNRIDGALHEVLSLPQSMAQALVSRIKIMADLNIVERRRPQDGQISTVVDGRELDIRVSTTATVNGEKTVLRILDKARALYDVSTLGMPEDAAAVYRDIIKSPYGMVVCAGPTGSGKTTTLYATLMAINNEEINVMTVEDPVEYTFPTINQIGIHEMAGLTFAAGLRSILRQDPDAILVGEIRDVETARIAIQAALTGHFVMSTIHATDASSALHRFLDMGIESFLLASSMLAVVGQRLVRRSCRECLEPYEPSTEDVAFYERAGGKPKETYLRGRGCAECAGTGYSGRIGVYEILKLTDEMRELVIRSASVDEVRALATDQGMVPMRDQALRLVADDVTTISEVMRTIYIL